MNKYIFAILFSAFSLISFSQVKNPESYLSIPIIDLNDEFARQVVVDREEGQYLGHPTTVLLEDGRTILTVYPKGHGRGEIVYKRSADGGQTWSERLPTPESWKTSLEVPTIFPTVGPDGEKHLIMFSGLYPARLAHSEDIGLTWSELERLAKEKNEVNYSRIASETGQGSPTEGDWAGWVGTWKDLVKGKPGKYRIRFKDNYHDWDCCYPGVELLPDGTFVVTTYGHWEKDEEPYIISVRVRMGELDAKYKKLNNTK